LNQKVKLLNFDIQTIRNNQFELKTKENLLQQISQMANDFSLSNYALQSMFLFRNVVNVLDTVRVLIT